MKPPDSLASPPPDLRDLDLELLAELQRLTPAERMVRHEDARKLVVALREAVRRYPADHAGAADNAD